MNWPIYFKDNLWISNLESSNAVVTLWTPKELIAQGLDPKSFAVCGQLYSKRGINYILRNIFANPRVRNIVICGADRSESGKAIVNFFEKGIDENHSIVDIEKAIIEKELPLESINSLRQSIEYKNMIGSIDVKSIQSILNGFVQKEPFMELTLFPEAKIEKPNQYPSEGSVFNVRSKYIKEAWPQIIRQIMKFGGEYKMLSNSSVRELVNVVTVISDEDPMHPEMVDDFDFNLDELDLYITNFLESNAGSEDYNYGERIFNFKFFSDHTLHKMRKKMEKIEEELGFKSRNVLKGIDQFDISYRKLKSFKQDRGALVTLWSTGRDNLTSNPLKVPCLTFLQFMIRDEKLHLNAYFRSNDMFKAWPRNAFALRSLQKKMSDKLQIPIGVLTTFSTLAQVYEEDWVDALKLIKKYENNAFCIQELRSSIIIECIEKDIVVRHMSPDGNTLLDEFKTSGMQYKAALKMTDILVAHDLFSNYGHAMDIGRELMKAEMAIKENYLYIQDRDYLEIAKGMSTVDVMNLYKNIK